ncbi:MAG TPA: hypothetical protein DEQ30_10290 [Porphyromonadaceae bacterium]|nr:hypothetical protein [Porphyromonadaceae bacterium]
MEKLVLGLMFFVFIFSGCSNDSMFLESKDTYEIKKDIEYESVVEKIIDFSKTHSDSPNITVRSSDLGDNMVILNSKKKTYSFDLDSIIQNSKRNNEIKLRTSQLEDESEISVYTIEFKKNGTKGFAIATSDERIKGGVYAYTPYGELSDTTYNLGLKWTLHQIERICELELIHYYSNDKEASTIKRAAAVSSERLLIEPLTGLTWNQTAPYNNYVPLNCSNLYWTYNGKAYAGCTAISCAQVIAYLSPFAIRDQYELEYIKSRRYLTGDPDYPSVTDANKVARFISYVGDVVGMDYKCSGSSAAIKNIIPKLQEWEIRSEHRKDENVDLSRLAYNLSLGYPHITSGIDKSTKSGHSWIWEGIDCYVTGLDFLNGKYNIASSPSVQLYCNWGWGGSSNGWYANFEEPIDDITGKRISWYVDDNCQLYIYNMRKGGGRPPRQ